MTERKIGILHPGAMGISVAASAVNSGYPVYWASEGRSEASRVRAAEHSLQDVGTLERLCATCNVILSVCPPHAAQQVADQVLETGFRGLYLDANAISPFKAKRLGELMQADGVFFVDGGIIGGPAWKPGTTWLYLSGEHAPDIAECFKAGPLETEIIGEEIGKASALKMCYAALTKGTTALLCAVMGAAETLDVRSELYRQWTRDDATWAERNEKRVIGSTEKAWRFEGEMHEIADTFELAGIPDGFHLAAAEIYERLAPLKDIAHPTLTQVLAALTHE